MKIAIIGTGIAGMGSAWLLHTAHDITVYEKNAYIGGHSNTVEATLGGRTIPVDTGFIVYNERNYPNLTALFRHLNVATEKSDMSFGVSLEGGGFEYSGRTPRALFAQASNALKGEFWQMLLDIVRFNRRATLWHERNRAGGPASAAQEQTLGEFLDKLGVSAAFKTRYLLPMGAAIWSGSLAKMLAYPAETFVRFFYNHGLLTITNQPQWYTVTGGSREYVKTLTAPFRGRIRLNCGAVGLTREPGGVRVRDAQGGDVLYDAVVLACHADEALALLGDAASGTEREVLGAFGYQDNIAVLHSDPALMPKRRAAWASWNVLTQANSQESDAVTLTYWMNLLQNIDHTTPLFVTLNPLEAPNSALTHARIAYTHPVFDRAAIRAQARLGEIQGKQGVWFAGAHWGYGFHEDGLKSAVAVANALGVRAPWQADAHRTPS